MRGALNPAALEAFPHVRAWLGYTRIEHREAKPSPEVLLSFAERNVVVQLDNLRSHPTVANRLKEGNLSLYGWVYHIASGTVTAYDEASGQFLQPAACVTT
jgi:carbonic anhydrase